MKSRHPFMPFALLALVWLVFAAYVWLSAAQLPERVATHFGVNGVPNGWMTRAHHVRFTLIMGLGIPAFVIGIFAVIRHFDAWLNIPHKDYWLAPERRQVTLDFIQRQGFWFAGLFIAFVGAIHYSIIAANSRSPVALPPSEAVWIGSGFIAVALVWVATFIGRFSRKPV